MGEIVISTVVEKSILKSFSCAEHLVIDECIKIASQAGNDGRR